MAKCNLKMNADCYGCPYYGTGDVEGCRLTIAFHKKYPNHTDEEYKQYMISNRIKKQEEHGTNRQRCYKAESSRKIT